MKCISCSSWCSGSPSGLCMACQFQGELTYFHRFGMGAIVLGWFLFVGTLVLLGLREVMP